MEDYKELLINKAVVRSGFSNSKLDSNSHTIALNLIDVVVDSIKERFIPFTSDTMPKDCTKTFLFRYKDSRGSVKFGLGHRMNENSNAFIIGNHFSFDLGEITHYMDADFLFF